MFDVIPSPGNLFISNDTIRESALDQTFVAIILTDSVRTGDTIDYSLVAGVGSEDNHLFVINGNQLILNSPVDFESQSSYSVRIQSTFSDGVVLEQYFDVAVEDVNEKPGAIVSSVLSMDEGIDPGTVVAQLTSTDPDLDDEVHLSLPFFRSRSNDNSLFSIVENQLIINTVPDFEAQEQYELLVRATDLSGLFVDQAVVLTVNDLNEPPSDIIVTAFDFDEGLPSGSTVAHLSSDDPDLSDSITFSLISDSDQDQMNFNIDDDRLNILFSPDFETQSTYQVLLRAGARRA